MNREANEQEYYRRKNLDEFRTKGIDPYPNKYETTHRTPEFHYEFGHLQAGEMLDQQIRIAGRVMAIRTGGKLSFLDLHDEQGKLQLMVSLGEIGEEPFRLTSLLDIGDIIGVSGKPIRSRRGELSLVVTSWQLLSKCLLPLPEKWHGLRDVELRYRQRYLDLIMNPQTRQLFRLRSQFISVLRQFMADHEFIEVETPTLEHVPGGADAKPFITHHNTLDLDLFLRISLELHLKRLIVGGYERVYELGKVFRNEGMSAEHLQEFTMMECYWAYIDYRQLMDFIENLYCRLLTEVFGDLKVSFRGNTIDFTPPWPRIDYRELILQHTGLDLELYKDEEKLAAELPKFDLEPDRRLGRGRLIDQLFKKTCRPRLMQPCFLIDHPVDISPLAKRHLDRPDYVQRFQVMFGGSEVGNGFSELNDADDQQARFKEQAILRERGDDEAQRFDHDFVRALQFAMPPTAGFGVGIDRFLYVLTDSTNIRETVFFPTMKPLTD